MQLKPPSQNRQKPSPLAEAKERLRIPEIWERLNLPGEPMKSCRSPFREDRSASFSVSRCGSLWNDFAEGTGGDAVDFLARILGVGKSRAAREFLLMARGATTEPMPLPARPEEERPPAPARPLPDLLPWELSDSWQLKKIRGWPVAAGPEIARLFGLLGACMLRDGDGAPVRCWAVTDSAGKVLQARRLDGEPFRHKWSGITWEPCSPYKAKTLLSQAGDGGWPVGAAFLRPDRAVVVVEGGPDLLAGIALAWMVEVLDGLNFVAMLGAAQRIHPKALPLFRNKRIRILTQADEPGRRAARQWAGQLTEAGAGHVDALTVTGQGVADLADLFAVVDLANDADDVAGLFAGLDGGRK